METERVLPISAVTVVEEVLQQHGSRLRDFDFASRKAEEAASRRHEAAGWLRNKIGFVGTKDLPAQPSEEEFRLALRNGIILCNILNKVQPGTIPKVVEVPVDSIVLPDGAALSAYQHFENIRNFLDAMQEMGLPSFAASDLEKGGNGVRVVNCILALKSYCGWKETGGNGSWKYGGNLKPINSTKSFVRKNSEPFMNSLLRTASTEKSLDSLSFEQNGELPQDSSKMNSSPLNALVRAVLADKRPEEIPMLVESMLSKVMEEFEHRLASQNELVKTTVKDLATSDGNKSIIETESSGEMKMDMEEETGTQSKDEELFHVKPVDDEESKCQLLKQQMLFEKQQREIQELKHVLHATRTGMQFIQTNYSEEFCSLGRHLHVVSQAASGYHKVLEENRKLYNQVQDLKGSIRVYCRVRPFLHGQPDRQSTVDRIDDGSITVITPSKYGKEGRKSFNFNKVFGPSATQEEVFIDTQPLIRSVLDGYNVCIFAYGQTGSGKTFTMSGPNELTEESQGVNYRALNDLFYLSKQRKGTVCYDISVQMLEIYNEQVRDLLASDAILYRACPLLVNTLEIRNSSQKGLNVPDANLVPVASTLDVIELMNTGQKNRAVSSTAMNDRSSRSHSCLTVHVQGRDTVSGTILRGSLHLVDLAGSERVDKSEVVGDRLKEAQHINKSLAALGDVISALAQKNSHVPYRNSKLTQLLQDSLGGQAKTLMFVHMSPEVDAIGETISTLKFAERVATIELGAARANKETGDVKELKEQIANLKAALARKECEPEHLSSLILSSEVSKMKAGGLSSIHSNQQNGDMLIDHSKHRQPTEDVGNIEVSDNSDTKQNGLNLDHLELLIPAESPSWAGNSPGADLQKGDEKDVGSDDWVEKTMVKKNEAGGAPLRRRLEGSNGSLPESFYQKALSEAKIHPEKQYKTQLTRKDSRGYESATTDDSDDLEMASSDCSEGDVLWQCNLPKVSSPANGVGSKNRKPHTRPAKSPDLRSPSPSPSSRKLNGGSQTPNRNGRPPSVDGKRSSSSRKSGSGK
ncbi:hypothetical protein AAC387_Pa09g1393 [Persea americana]